MPGPANVPQVMSFDPAFSWWVAEGIPLTPYDDGGQKNYYPMMHLVARDASNAILATTDIVLPVSDEMTCKLCHSSTSGPAAQPSGGWVADPIPEREFRLNILLLHDERQAQDPTFASALSGAGYDAAGLYATVQGGVSILCARCHSSEALGGGGQADVLPLTQVLHGLHAGVIDPVNGLTLGSSANRSACYRCHPGSDTRCLRGAMGSAVAADGSLAIQCQSCHGSMIDVASPSRTGWLNEPNCQECHTGTATSNNGQIRYVSVFESPGVPRVPVDTTFATNPDTPAGFSLFRFSTGHGGLKCEACHGSTHAVFPSSHLNDNVQSVERQGHKGMLVECSSCHGTSPVTVTGGPHGMHPVGSAWVQQHPNAAEQGGTAQCRVCHGTNYRGTVLSHSQADRMLSTEFGTKMFWRGFQIGCYTCHRGPNDESANPNRAPVVMSRSIGTGVDVPVSAILQASDADGNGLTLRIVSQAAHGTVGLSGTMATYFPEAGFSGVDTFTFAAWDGSTDSNLGTITVSVGVMPPTATPTGPLGAPTPTPNPACGSAPHSGCRSPGKSVFVLEQHAGKENRDRVIWRWLRGAATTQAEFADPTSTASYLLCVYDAGGAMLGMQVPPSATAWKMIERGYRYVDHAGTADGMQKIVLTGNDADRSRIVVRGVGVGVPDPVLGAPVPPLVVQLTNSDNNLCWEAQFPAGSILRSDAGHLRAKVSN